MTTAETRGLYDRVAELLDSLGVDPAAVAATLRVADIRGVRGSAVAHPVCWWLIRLVPDVCVVLSPDTVHVSVPDGGLARHAVVVPLPPAVRSFVRRFDQGQHPDLELWLGAAGRQPEPGDGYRPDPALSAPALGEDTYSLPVLPARGVGTVIDGELVMEQ